MIRDLRYKAVQGVANVLMLISVLLLCGSWAAGAFENDPLQMWLNALCLAPCLVALVLVEQLGQWFQGLRLWLSYLLAELVLTGACVLLGVLLGRVSPLLVFQAAAINAVILLYFGHFGAVMKVLRMSLGALLYLMLAAILFGDQVPPVYQIIVTVLAFFYLLSGVFAMSMGAQRAGLSAPPSYSVRRGAAGMVWILLGITIAVLVAVILARALRPEWFAVHLKALTGTFDVVKSGKLPTWDPWGSTWSFDFRNFRNYWKVRSVFMTVMAAAVLYLIIRGTKTHRKKLKRFFKERKGWYSQPTQNLEEEIVDWEKPERAGFGRWLWHRLRHTAHALRPKKKLDENAPLRIQARFVYRALLRERAEEAPEVLSMTPEELLSGEETTEQDYSPFAEIYNKARYSNLEVSGPEVREMIWSAYQELEGK